MKAIVFDRYGTADVLRLAQVESPPLGRDDVMVRVHAVPATRADCQMRQADPFIARLMFGLLKPKRLMIPGAELSGEVVAVGDNVQRFKVGDRVWASLGEGLGALAELASIPESAALAPLPARLSYGEAAAICEGALTALTFLRDTGHIARGQRVLINGASGAVGSSAVQLAKHFGAHVTGVCSTDNVQLVKSLGADEVIDYKQVDFAARGSSYQLIFDTVGKSSFGHAKPALAPGGVYLSPVLGISILLQTLWTKQLGRKKAAITFAGLRTPEQKRADMSTIARLIEAGELRPVIDRRYPIEQAAEAYRYVETGHKKGNVIVDVVSEGAAG